MESEFSVGLACMVPRDTKQGRIDESNNLP